MYGRLLEIYIAPSAGALMQPVASVRAITGRGLEGDRYASKTGTYSNFSKMAHEVTLFAHEALWDLERDFGIPLHPAQTRRNLITEGMALHDLVDREFTIGAVRFRGLRPCPPCLYLAQLLKMPAVLKGLARSGGLYAEILSDGVITAGDDLLAGTEPPQRPVDNAAE